GAVCLAAAVQGDGAEWRRHGEYRPPAAHHGGRRADLADRVGGDLGGGDRCGSAPPVAHAWRLGRRLARSLTGFSASRYLNLHGPCAEKTSKHGERPELRGIYARVTLGAPLFDSVRQE